MKIKPRTVRQFQKWCESHKMSDTFIWAGQPIKGSDFKKMVGGEEPKADPKPTPIIEEPVNIDIQEEQDADMGEPLHSRDTEEH